MIMAVCVAVFDPDWLSILTSICGGEEFFGPGELFPGEGVVPGENPGVGIGELFGEGVGEPPELV